MSDDEIAALGEMQRVAASWPPMYRERSIADARSASTAPPRDDIRHAAYAAIATNAELRQVDAAARTQLAAHFGRAPIVGRHRSYPRPRRQEEQRAILDALASSPRTGDELRVRTGTGRLALMDLLGSQRIVTAGRSLRLTVRARSEAVKINRTRRLERPGLGTPKGRFIGGYSL